MPREHLPITPGLLPRPRLGDLLQQSLPGQFTAVVAPPGYGKTQAVAQFVKKSRRRLIWLALAPRDNDTALFWAALLAALRPELPRLAARYTDPHQLATAGSGSFTAAFAEELATGHSATLVLDNYNLIHSPEVRGIVRGLIDSRLAHLSIILISNSRRDLHIAREQYGQPHSILTAEQLRFTRAETAALHALCGKTTTQTELDALYTGTEGWPLMVHLACRHTAPVGEAAPQRPYAPQAEELFETGYFGAYPPALQQLCVKLSLFPSFSFEMVKALAGATFEQTHQQLTANIFITAADETRQLRFHKMYREFLNSKKYILDTGTLLQTYRTAGTYYRANELYPEAVEAFYHAGQYHQIIDTLLQAPVQRRPTHWATHILDYLGRLPPDFVASNPAADLCAANLYLNNLETEKAAALLDSIRQRQETANLPDPALLGEVYAVLAGVSLLQNTTRFVEYLANARALLPQGSRTRRPKATLAGNNDIFYLPSRGAGQAQRVVDAVFAAAADWAHVYGGHGAGFAWQFAAEHAFFSGDFEQAAAHCAKAAYTAAEQAQHDIFINAHFLLARAHAMQGNYRQTTHHWALITEHISRHPCPETANLRGVFESWYYLLIKDYGRVPHWLAEFEHTHLAIPLGERGRGLMLYVWYLMSKKQYREALVYIEQQETVARKRGLWALRLYAYLARAGCCQCLGQSAAALEALWQAYQMAYRNGIVTPFASLGPQAVALCDIARRSARHPFAPGWLDAVTQRAALTQQNRAALISAYRAQNTPVKLLQPLTQREKQALQHLAQGHTRDEIAAQMGISVSGVKSHIANIYNKLGAANRADAVRKAALAGEISLGQAES